MLQIYTGNGKGKTTAAVGLAVRAAGAGMRVLFAQLMKNVPTAESKVFALIKDRIVYSQFGTGKFIIGKPAEEDYEAASNALLEVEEAVGSGEYQLVIADELCTALSIGLIRPERVFRLIQNCPQSVELVFTGRNASPELVERADLVTEMREVKHYYNSGADARPGIEF